MTRDVISDIMIQFRAIALDNLHNKDRWGIEGQHIDEEMMELMREYRYGRGKDD